MSGPPNGTDSSDNALWLQLRAGKQSALESLATNWYRPLFHYGGKLTHDHALVQDCIQDLFLTLWEKHPTLAPVDSVRAYLFVSLRNNLLRRVKQNSAYTRLTDSDDPADGLADPESRYTQAEAGESLALRLHQSLERLPKRQREAIYLRYYENLRYDEIATVMGLNRQVVANYLQNALHTLRDYWQDLSYGLLLISFLL